MTIRVCVTLLVMCDIVAAEGAKVGASLDALIIVTQNAVDGKQPWVGGNNQGNPS